MPDTALTSSFRPGLHRFAALTAGCTLVLIAAGGLVTSKDAGLAVPDWPLSYGTLFPQMVGNIRFEHGHRLIAGTVALMMAALCIWLWVHEPRRNVVRLGFLAMGAVLAQAALGGITVIYLLPKPVSIAHACLAQAFFCLVVSIAWLTSREWYTPVGERAEPRGGKVHAWTIAAVATVYIQLILGAVVRHFDAGPAIPDFPLMLGRILPPLNDSQVVIHFAHRTGALTVAIILGITAVQILVRHGSRPRLARVAWLVLGLVVAQIALGATTVLTGMAVAPATLHVATGAFLLAVCLVLCLRVHRYVAKPVRTPAGYGVRASAAHAFSEEAAS